MRKIEAANRRRAKRKRMASKAFSPPGISHMYGLILLFCWSRFHQDDKLHACRQLHQSSQINPTSLSSAPSSAVLRVLWKGYQVSKRCRSVSGEEKGLLTHQSHARAQDQDAFDLCFMRIVDVVDSCRPSACCAQCVSSRRVVVKTPLCQWPRHDDVAVFSGIGRPAS
jgi:hypothetical protein